MASTTFVSNVTKIVRAWLQDVNDSTYGPTAPTTTLRGQLADSTSASNGTGLLGWLRAATGAVASTLYRWLDWQAPSVAEFMTEAQRADCKAGTALIDCSAAVQAAVTHCIANNVNLKNPYKKVYLASSVNIDRQVDGAAFDSFFTIHGGGFYAKAAIALFSSSIAFTTAPVSQLVRFNQVNFEASGTGFDAYVLDDARFLRTQFDGCDFVKIKCLKALTVHVQSLYFFHCNMRRWVGTFFDCQAVNFDVKFQGCLAEAAERFATMAFPVGCSFLGNTLEGMSDMVLRYWGAQGLSMHGNYFEGSLFDIDGTTVAGETSYGVSVLSNYFSNFGGNPSLIWGLCESCVSEGNYASHDLHQLASNSKVRINDTAIGDLTNLPAGSIYLKTPYNAPAFSARANADQGITTTTFTKITFGTEEFDTNANFASSTFTPTVAGYYEFDAVVKVTGTSITRVAIGLYKNGSEFARLYDVPLASVASWMTAVSGCVSMNGTTDFIEMWVFVIATTPSVKSDAASDTSRFSARYLRNNG